MEQEQEFSFKDFIIYIIKKWFIILVTTVAVALGFFIYAVLQPRMQNNPSGEGYMVSIRFASIETYMENRQINILEPTMNADKILAINELYKITANAALADLGDDAVLINFLKDNSVLNDMKTLYYPEKEKKALSATEQKQLYYKSFKSDFTTEISRDNWTFKLRFNNWKIIDTDATRTAIENILDKYAKAAVLFAVENNKETLDVPGGTAFIISSAEQTFAVSDTTVIEPKTALTQVALGLAAGLAVGIIIVVIIYFLDGRIKSYSQISPLAGVLLSKSSLSEIDNAAVAKVVSNNADKKSLGFLCFNDGNKCADFAFLTAEYFAALNKNVLLICCDNTETESGLSKLLSGADLSGDSQLVKKISASPKDFFFAASNTNKYEQAVSGFDKVIISASDNNDGVAESLSKLCDDTVFVIDQKIVKLSRFLQIFESAKFDQTKVLGTYIHNPL